MTFEVKNIETHFAYICWHFNNARNSRIRNYWFCIRKKKLKKRTARKAPTKKARRKDKISQNKAKKDRKSRKAIKNVSKKAGKKSKKTLKNLAPLGTSRRMGKPKKTSADLKI